MAIYVFASGFCTCALKAFMNGVYYWYESRNFFYNKNVFLVLFKRLFVNKDDKCNCNFYNIVEKKLIAELWGTQNSYTEKKKEDLTTIVVVVLDLFFEISIVRSQVCGGCFFFYHLCIFRAESENDIYF